MRKKIGNALIELGITPDLKGFDYICSAIEIISKSNEKIKLVDGVYVDVAKEFDTTASSVGRAIRHAFSKMDKNNGAYKKYIGIDKSTNSALLYTLAYKLKEV